MDLGHDDDTAPAPAVAKKGGKLAAAATATAAAQKQPWPNTLPEQMRAVAALLNAAGRSEERRVGKECW